MDGDAIEDLLKEKDLVLNTAITKCRAQKAARKQRAEMSSDGQVNAVRQWAGRTSAQQQDRMSAQQQDCASVQKPRKSCMGCGFPQHPGGRQQCPAYSRICHFSGKPGHLAKVCKSWLASNSYPHSARFVHIEALEEDPYPHSAMSVHVEPLTHQVNTSSAVGGAGFDPAPSIDVAMSSLNGQAAVRVLLDSGADVSVVGELLLNFLREHPDNLLPSSITPSAVNGTRMRPIGRIPVTLSLDGREFVEDFHIYPQVSRVLLSWKAAKGLHGYTA